MSQSIHSFPKWTFTGQPFSSWDKTSSIGKHNIQINDRVTIKWNHHFDNYSSSLSTTGQCIKVTSKIIVIQQSCDGIFYQLAIPTFLIQNILKNSSHS